MGEADPRRPRLLTPDEMRWERLEQRVKDLERLLEFPRKGRLILPPALGARPAKNEIGFNPTVGHGRLEVFDAELDRVVYFPGYD